MDGIEKFFITWLVFVAVLFSSIAYVATHLVFKFC